MGLMNKILLVLIIVSGFLLIFYANNDIFTRTNHMFSGLFHGRNSSTGTSSAELMDGPVAMAALLDAEAPQPPPQDDFAFSSSSNSRRRNKTIYHLFVIYTKETDVLQKKYELLLKSLFKYTTVPLHLHIITDAKSTFNAEDVARIQMHRYHRHALISLLDVDDCVEKIKDIVEVMMPYFSSHPGEILIENVNCFSY